MTVNVTILLVMKMSCKLQYCIPYLSITLVEKYLKLKLTFVKVIHI